MQMQSVTQRMREYHSMKEQNCPASPDPIISPRSFVSQAEFIPRSRPSTQGSDGQEEDLSQMKFHTQAFSVLPVLNAETQTVLSSLPKTEDDNDFATPADAATAVSVNTSLNGSDQASAQRSGVTTNEVEHEKSSPIEMVELGANSLVSQAPSLAEAEEKPPDAPTTEIRKDIETPVSLSELLVRPFGRWQRHVHRGRYIPRSVAKIPKDQQALLESLLANGDSWQPPLVGHPQHPGSVPVTLLEAFSVAADRRVENAAIEQPDESSSESSTLLPRRNTEVETAEPKEDDENEIEGSIVDWSQSQPSQRRHRRSPLSKLDDPPANDSDSSEDLTSSPPIPNRHFTFLPQNTPPPSPRNARQSISRPGTPGRRRLGRDSTNDSVQRHLKGAEIGEKTKSPDTVDSSSVSCRFSVHGHPRRAVAETPPSSRNSQTSSGNGTDPGKRPSVFSQALSDLSAKKIQVKATPFQVDGRKSHTGNANRSIEPHDPTSSVVPGIYTSLSSINKTPMTTTREPAPTSVRNDSPIGSVVDAILRQSAAEVATQNTSTKTPTRERGSDPPPRIAPRSGLLPPENEAARTVEIISQAQNRESPLAAGPREVHIETAADIVLVRQTSVTSLVPKRKREASEHEGLQKRPRATPQPAIEDPDLLAVQEKVSAHRREHLQAIAKPKAPFRQSSSSSVMEIGNGSGAAMAPPTTGRQPDLFGNSRSAWRLSSTLLTRQSMYSETSNKIRRRDSTSMTMERIDHLFTKYRTTYPDYEGSADEFCRSYYFLQGVLNGEPNKIHSSLLDDAIFHDYHSYQPYREQTGESALSFVQYFNECVDDPTHHKRVIKFPCIEGRSSSNLSRAHPSPKLTPRPQVPTYAASISETVAHPTSSAKEEIDEARQRFLDRLAPPTRSAPDVNGSLSQESIASIEKWREQAAARESPELGSSDIDRIELATTRQEGPVASNAGVASNRQTSALSTRPNPILPPPPRPKSTLTTPKNRTLYISGIPPKSPASAPVVKPSIKSEFDALRPAAKPSAPVSIATSSPRFSQSQSQPRLVGNDTTFVQVTKEYAARYAALHAAKREKAAFESGGVRNAIKGKGIDMSKWRK